MKSVSAFAPSYIAVALPLCIASSGCSGGKMLRGDPAYARIPVDQVSAFLDRAASTQDTLIPIISALPAVRDTVVDSGCRSGGPSVISPYVQLISTACNMRIVDLGRDARTLLYQLAQRKTLLLRDLDAYGLAPIRYHFESAYPTIPSQDVYASRAGTLYVSDRIADSISAEVASLIGQLRSKAARNPVDLKIDVLPLGSIIRVQALGGDPHETIANYPILGLWRGKYDYWVFVRGRLRQQGRLDFFNHSGEVLRCRFDDSQPEMGGCTQAR
jgi:hypothetical protein